MPIVNWYRAGLLIAYVLFFQSLLVGGYTFDEGVHFDSTLWQFDFARGLLWGDPSPRAGIVLHSFHQIFTDYAYYGLGTLGPAYFISSAVDAVLGLSHEWYHSYSTCLHILAFLYAMLAVRYVRKFVLLATGDVDVSCLAALSLMLTPWWLGYSYFDYKDVPIASALIVTTYYAYSYARDPRGGTLACFFAALLLLAAQRVAAMPLAFPACLAVALAALHPFRLRRILALLGCAVLFLLALYLVTPPAWREPFDFVVSSVAVMSQHQWEGCTLTAGNCIGRNHDGGAGYSAGRYLATWYGVQLPLLMWLGVTLGGVAMAADLRRGRFRGGAVGWLVPAALVWPILALVAGNSTLYNGIRHTLFLAPLLVVFIFTAIRARVLMSIRYVLAAYLVFFVVDTVRLQPYGYVWFNEIGRFVADDTTFASDYWGYSLREMTRAAKASQQADEWVVGFPTSLVEPDVTTRMALVGNNFAKIAPGTKYLLVSIPYFASDNCKVIDSVSRRELFSPNTLHLAFLERCKAEPKP